MHGDDKWQFWIDRGGTFTDEAEVVAGDIVIIETPGGGGYGIG